MRKSRKASKAERKVTAHADGKGAATLIADEAVGELDELRDDREVDLAPPVVEVAPLTPPVVTSAPDPAPPVVEVAPPVAGPLIDSAVVGNAGRLGDQLIGSGLVTVAQLNKALVKQRESGGRLGEVLVAMGSLSEQSLAHALAAFFGTGVANLRRDKPDPTVLPLLKEDAARRYMAIPIRLEGDVLQIAVAEPTDELRDVLARESNYQVRLLIAPLSDIHWAIDNNYRAIGAVEKLVQAFEAVEETRRRSTETPTPAVMARTRRSCRWWTRS